ncbi:MAG: hypothetical protein WC780_09860 [Lentimicrobiaceae bacterium]|jgi:hypothetical protein
MVYLEALVHLLKFLSYPYVHEHLLKSYGLNAKPFGFPRKKPLNMGIDAVAVTISTTGIA